MKDFPRNLPEFDACFSSEAACVAYLMRVRWPEGWRCGGCGARRGWRNRRDRIECAACGRQSSVTAGTIFHGTRKPLRLWFKAVFLMTAAKNGISAKALARLLGLSYPTAWTWLQKLRRALCARSRLRRHGPVEVDEAYIGGHRAHQRGGRCQAGVEKDLIVVAVEERGEGMGRVRLSPARDHTQKTIAAAVAAQVVPRATVHTDGLSSYRQLPAYGLDHQPVVVGRDRRRAVTLLPRVHKVISLLKRWILGTHQGAVCGKHLAWYLEEFAFRFNRRRARHPRLLFQRLIQYGLDQPPQPYRDIVGSPPHTQPLHLAVT